ncbi:MAG: hemolysin family protein [Alphaproteobacteria bacterium]
MTNDAQNSRPSPLSSPEKKPGRLSGWLKKQKNGPAQENPAASSGINFEEGLITEQERVLLTNILKLRDLTAIDVMIPRGDIFALDSSLTQSELLELLARRQFSRIPVYKGTLDDVLGTIHIKDVLATLARGEEIEIEKLVTDAPIVSPAMTTLNLMKKMRQRRRHMAFVVDEFGGIDGLVTVNDILEAIIGEVHDEHDTAELPKIIMREDGSVTADARYTIEEFEQRFGFILTPDERDSSDTIGGLVLELAGRVPVRGEKIKHKTGMVFEVLDAEPQHVNLLRIKKIPGHKKTK